MAASALGTHKERDEGEGREGEGEMEGDKGQGGGRGRKWREGRDKGEMEGGRDNCKRRGCTYVLYTYIHVFHAKLMRGKARMDCDSPVGTFGTIDSMKGDGRARDNDISNCIHD